MNSPLSGGFAAFPIDCAKYFRRSSTRHIPTLYGILHELALAVSDAGVRLRIRGGRSVEEHQHHRNGARNSQRGLPRWPAAIALLAVGALYGVLSDGLTLGPRAFLLGLVAVLLVPC